MSKGDILHNALLVSVRLVRYNLKIIFANKFVYFFLAALFVFLLVLGINLFSAEAQPTEADIFWLLLVPGILLIFYPATFGIQNDFDSRMLELLFGIPNYRYKVWLLRLLLIFVSTFVILLIFSAFSAFALTVIPVLEMVLHLMFPIAFLGSLAFMMSTIIRNGSGTAVVMVILGLIFLIARGVFQDSPEWDLFLNPFDIPQNINEVAWVGIIIENRIYLAAGSILTILTGLLNLQKREKFLF
jgi:hypothetical protein